MFTGDSTLAKCNRKKLPQYVKDNTHAITLEKYFRSNSNV